MSGATGTSPNLFPSSNDPIVLATQEEVTQEVTNLSTLQAAITAAKNAITAAISALNNVSQASILSDATPFAGGNVAAIKAKTDLIPADLTTQIDTKLQEMVLQTPATLSQATPTQNTYYNILGATANVEAIYVAIKIATTGETLQVRLIIDGNTWTGSLSCAAGTLYYVTLSAFSDAGVPTFTIQTTAAPLGGSSYSLGGRSVQISVEKTTASGTGTLTGAVLYKSR